jgi:hypothetical protein
MDFSVRPFCVVIILFYHLKFKDFFNKNIAALKTTCKYHIKQKLHLLLNAAFVIYTSNILAWFSLSHDTIVRQLGRTSGGTAGVKHSKLSLIEGKRIKTYTRNKVSIELLNKL